MNDLEIAQKLIKDKNTNLTELSKTTSIAYSTLTKYRLTPDKMRKAAWEKIYALAEYARKENNK